MSRQGLRGGSSGFGMRRLDRARSNDFGARHDKSTRTTGQRIDLARMDNQQFFQRLRTCA
jgi:hypothetical protein